MPTVGSFAKVRDTLENQFKTPFFIEDSGLSKDELSGLAEVYTSSSLPKATAKARTLELLITKGRIGVDKDDIFQDKLDAIGIMSSE